MKITINTDDVSKIEWVGDLTVEDVERADMIFDQLVDRAVKNARLKAGLKGTKIPIDA